MSHSFQVFSIAVCLCLFSAIDMALANDIKPSATILPTPPELQSLGIAEHYLLLENFPRNKTFSLSVKRLIQKTPGYRIIETLHLDQDGIIEVNGQRARYYGLTPIGYAPGERVDYRILLDDGTLITEGFYVPRPIQKRSKKGSFTANAELISFGSSTRYEVNLTGLQKGELCQFTMISGQEVIEHPFEVEQPVMTLGVTPDAVGSKGGKSHVKILTPSGDCLIMTLPWGTAIAEPLLKEAKTNQAAPEFRAFKPDSQIEMILLGSQAYRNHNNPAP